VIAAAYLKRRLAPLLHVLDLGIAWAFDLPASRYGARRWLNQRRARKKLRRLARVNAEACKRRPWGEKCFSEMFDDWAFMCRERVAHERLRRGWLRSKRKHGVGFWAKARRAGLAPTRHHGVKASYIPR
jgi:hypothetical protein